MAEQEITSSPIQQTTEEHAVRLAKLRELQQRGVNPWPVWHDATATIAQLRASYSPEKSASGVVAGRVIAKREHGKTTFGHIQDQSGVIQFYCRNDNAAQAFEMLRDFIDIGDIVSIRGTLFVTKTGEVTLAIEELSLLSKCLYPLPEKFHGLSDQEIKYRQRYLDMITSADTRQRFIKRSNIISLLRKFLQERSYLEVETPMLHPIPGGAAARPFVTHHNALSSDFYLRIAPELYLKRLVVGGFERVFEINRNFRNEGISTRHNPEFTMVELYTAYQDYHYAMDLVEELIRSLAREVCTDLVVTYGERSIDFASPFTRLSMVDGVAQELGVSRESLTEEVLNKGMIQHRVELPKGAQRTKGYMIYALFEALVEPKIWQPTFVTEFPVEVSPLAKRSNPTSEFTDRFELFIGGMEIANGFNELNDPFDQAQRFAEQAKAGDSGDIEAHKFDQEFITALEYALPPTVGIGIGVDRLVMLLTNTTSIKEVILFPTLKRK